MVLLAAIVLALLCGWPTVSRGAGFALIQQGTAAMAQGNAFVAEADDPSAIFYNPAGLNQIKRPQAYVATFLNFPDREREYTVAPGDTLGEISAATLGTSRRAAEIAVLNGMDLEETLDVGRVLRIPPRSGPAPRTPPAGPAPEVSSPVAVTAPRTHRVEGGDTLYSLSRRYYGDGGRWREIAGANGLAEEDPLSVGEVLRIP